MKELTLKLIRDVLITLMFCCLPIVGKATTYYVSNAGNDSNSGLSSSLPWKTLAKVNAFSFKAGDQILFQRGGTFYGSLTVKQSGVSGSPITFSAYDSGANPVITGFTTVTSWVNLGNNIWESVNAVSSLSGCNMVTINGSNSPMGRYPKVTDTNKGYYTYQSHSGQTSITSSNLTGTPNWTGAEIVIRNQAYHLKRSTVTSQSGSTIYFGDIGEGFSDGNGFFFQNDMRCCTQQNDWYYNPSTKKIRIYSTSQPTNVNVASLENLVTINSSYLVFNNITFTGANGCAIYCWDNNPRFNHITVANCTFSQIGVCAIYTLIDYLSVSNNIISDCNTSAIGTSYGNHDQITGNTIQNIGLLPGMRNNKVYSMCNSAIECGNITGWTAKNNSLRNLGFNGISLLASDTVLIQNNFIDTYSTVLDDGGAIYIYTGSGKSCHAVKITGNICINGIGAVEGSAFIHMAPGIYLDLGATNTEISYNSIANTACYGIIWTSAGNNYAHHNTIFNASQFLFYSSNYGNLPLPTGDRIRNNIMVAKYNGISSIDYQKCLAFYFSGSNAGPLILASTTLDSNYYARPIADDKVVFVSIAWPGAFKTLAEWQSYSGQDLHSHKSPQAVKSVDDLQFLYNETGVLKTFALSQSMMDVKGIKYSGNVTLQPYSSIVLIRDYSAAEITSFTIPGQTGTSVINSSTRTIGITMPSGTSLTSLVGSFTLSAGATAKVGTTAQVSGTTINNFTNPVVYTVTAQDGVTTKNWTVTVTTAIASSPSFASGGTYELIARNSGKVIGISGASTADGALADQETYKGAASQQFVITDLGTGYYTISPTSATSKVLDVSGSSILNGAGIIQYSYNGGKSQQWKLVSMGSGYYQIINLNSNKCLDVTVASTADGALIQQYTCGGGTNQQFTLSRLKSAPVLDARIDTSLATHEERLAPTISIYPNPSKEGKFYVNLNSFSSDQTIDINIFNTKGDRLYSMRANAGSLIEVDSELKKGIYIVTITGQQVNVTRKLVVVE